jgi:hypothetical protein
MKIINTISWVVAIGVAASLAVVMPAFAQTGSQNVGINVQGGVRDGANGGMQRGGMEPGIFGAVSAVSGDTLTVTATARPNRPMPEEASTSVRESTVVAGTAYTVDTTNAKIYKGSATSTVSVSDIATGDTVMVQGTVTGTNIVATVIRDGVNGMMGGGKGFGGGHSASSTMPRPSSTPIIQGNGEPVIGGAIAAISGTTLTVTNASNVTYTIDAASSTVVVKGASSTFANVAVGDNVLVQGVVNGNSVTASSIIDQGAKGANASSTNVSSSKSRGGFGASIGGFFGSIGGFFQHLFGF